MRKKFKFIDRFYKKSRNFRNEKIRKKLFFIKKVAMPISILRFNILNIFIKDEFYKHLNFIRMMIFLFPGIILFIIDGFVSAFVILAINVLFFGIFAGALTYLMNKLFYNNSKNFKHKNIKNRKINIVLTVILAIISMIFTLVIHKNYNEILTLFIKL